MRTFIVTVRTAPARRIVAGTSFCEACGQVCTATCRREARLDHYHLAAQRDGTVRF